MFTLYLAAPTPYAPPCTRSPRLTIPCTATSRRPNANPNPTPNPNKAANIFMFDDGYLKLGDFGVSKVFKTLAWLSS